MEICLTQREVKKIRAKADEVFDDGDVEKLRDTLVATLEAHSNREMIEEAIDDDLDGVVADALEQWGEDEDPDEILPILRDCLTGVTLSWEEAQVAEPDEQDDEEDESDDAGGDDLSL